MAKFNPGFDSVKSFTDQFVTTKKQEIIIFTYALNLLFIILTASSLSDAFPLCSRSPVMDLALLFDFGIIVFHLPYFAHGDLVCRFENNLFRDAITSSTM